MLYDLSKHTDQQRALRRLLDLSKEQAVIELKKRQIRSLNQNRYLHLILGWFAIELGYTQDESKQLYRASG